MKNIIKKNKNSIDAIAEARKFKAFQELSKDTDARLRLAVEVYNQREKFGLSQQDLAKKIGSTQKVISKIENGDVNVGMDLLNRVARQLDFNSETFARIFYCTSVYLIKKEVTSKSSENTKFSKVIDSNFCNTNCLSIK